LILRVDAANIAFPDDRPTPESASAEKRDVFSTKQRYPAEFSRILALI